MGRHDGGRRVDHRRHPRRQRGLTAKAWQSEVPPFEDLPVTLESERYAIDALVAVGARIVSVAEPAPPGSPIGSIQFHTRMALSAFAMVGSADSFDPMVPIVADGTRATTRSMASRCV